MRKNELASLKSTLPIRRASSRDKKEVNDFYSFSANDYLKILDEVNQNITKFETCLVDLDIKYSKSYQKIGIDECRVEEVQYIAPGGKKKSAKCYQYSAKFIFREKEKIKTIEIETYKSNEIVLEGKTYQYVNLHFSIIPECHSIVLDSRCNLGALEHYLKKIFLKFFKKEKNLNIRDEYGLEKALNVTVSGDLRKDYKDVINQNNARLHTFGLKFGKTKKAINVEELNKNQDSEEDFLESKIHKLMSVFTESSLAECQELLEYVKIEIKFDTSKAQQKKYLKLLNTARKKALKNLQELNKEDYSIKEAFVEYYDDDANDILKAVKRGLVKTLTNTLALDLHDNHQAMWNVQKEHFGLLYE